MRSCGQKELKPLSVSPAAERAIRHLYFSEIHTSGIRSREKSRTDRFCFPSGLRIDAIQPVPNPVPSSVTAESAGTPVCYSLIHKAGVKSSEHTSTDQPCIQQPSVAGNEPPTNKATNRGAPSS